MKKQHNVPLAPYTSLHAGGVAQTLVTLESGDHLQEVITGLPKDEPIWVLGFGTNVLISDKGLPGTVVLNQGGEVTDLGLGSIRVDSGVQWDTFIQQIISKGLWGLEFTSGIPGGVGAAIVGNIAAYGHKVADCFKEATILDTSDRSVKIWDTKVLQFDYRTSILQSKEQSHQVVLNATFVFNAEATSELAYESALKVARELNLQADSLEHRRQIIMETRKRAGSLFLNTAAGPWTAGSFFKNPVVGEEQLQELISHEEKGITREQLLRQNVLHGQNQSRVSAAHVLLSAGFHRGQTWGEVRLHPDHILKIENVGKASSQEMYNVVQHILETVKSRLGIELEPEVRFLGEF